MQPRWSLRRKWPEYDVAVCAGDLSDSIALSVAHLATHPTLSRKPAILVAGNHEYWDQEVGEAEEAGRWAARGTNVHFLQGESIQIGDVTFAGATLWTDYALLGSPVWHAAKAASEMEDHNRIVLKRPDGRTAPFMPGDAAATHATHRASLEACLNAAKGKTVVVTHHLPSRQSVDPAQSDDLDPAYASDMEAILSSRKPSLWVHGHTHASKDYVIGETRVVCNPKGYGPSRTKGGRFPSAENPGFKPGMIVEI